MRQKFYSQCVASWLANTEQIGIYYHACNIVEAHTVNRFKALLDDYYKDIIIIVCSYS